MENKLPRIGARYQQKNTRTPDRKITVVGFFKERILVIWDKDIDAIDEDLPVRHYNRKGFNLTFEELPEEPTVPKARCGNNHDKLDFYSPCETCGNEATLIAVGKLGGTEEKFAFLSVSSEGPISKMKTTEKPEQKLPEVGKSYRGRECGRITCPIKSVSKDFITFEGHNYGYSPESFWMIFEEIEGHKEEGKPCCDLKQPNPCQKCLKLWQEKLDEVNSAINEKESSAKEEEKPTPYIDSILKENDSILSVVDKALEELKKHLYFYGYADNYPRDSVMNDPSGEFNQRIVDLLNRTKALVNALEEEKKNQAVRANPAPLTDREKISQKQDKNEENLPNEEVMLPSGKGIWKDVSELPSSLYSPFVYIRFKNDMISPARFDDYFINPQATHIYPKETIKEWCFLTDFINDHESEKKARVELERRVIFLENK